MANFSLIISLILGFLALLCLYRGILGPTIFDRIISVSVIGTKTTIILLLMGVIYDRIDMFVDISIVYSLLNFMATLGAAKYFQRRGTL